jgi:hypothetical protein
VANPDLQARALDLVGNIAVDPPDATRAVFRGPFPEIALDMLQSGGMTGRRSAMRIVLRLVARVPFPDVAEFLLAHEALQAVVALLDADDAELLEDALRCLLAVVSRAQSLDDQRRRGITTVCDATVAERLNEIASAAPDHVGQLARGILEIARIYRESVLLDNVA